MFEYKVRIEEEFKLKKKKYFEKFKLGGVVNKSCVSLVFKENI